MLTLFRSPSVQDLLLILHHFLRLYTETGLELPPCKNTGEALLSASKFAGLSDRENILIAAARLRPEALDPDMRAEIAHRLSVVLRCRGRVLDSERIITEFFTSQCLDLNQRSTHFLGLLNLSQAQNLAYRFDFEKAREETRKWRPSGDDPLSDSELRLLCDQLCCTGRILKGEGHFDRARLCFEGCLATPGLPGAKRFLIVSHLSDLCCELDYTQRDNTYHQTPQSTLLDEGREMVQRELMRARDKPSKGLRRLLLSLIEIELRQGYHARAKSLIMELLDIYSSIAEPDVDDRVGHVRTLVASARISQPWEAERHWNAALLQNSVYNPLEEEVFTCGVIYVFIASVRFQVGDVAGSRCSFEKATEVFRKKKPQFLMPGIGTYLFDFVRSKVQSEAGWVLPDIAE